MTLDIVESNWTFDLDVVVRILSLGWQTKKVVRQNATSEVVDAEDEGVGSERRMSRMWSMDEKRIIRSAKKY